MGLFKSSKPTPVDGAPVPIAEYKVSYRGGLAALPKAKVGEIILRTWDDRFGLSPTIGSKKFWPPLRIPYAAISDVQIVRRQVTGAEALLSAGSRNGTRGLEQNNNIHIHYTDDTGAAIVLRLEMLTGFNITTQAKRAAEFNDLLQARGIRARFQQPVAQPGVGSVADELGKLQQLAASGVLSPEEFAAAKARLLGL